MKISTIGTGKMAGTLGKLWAAQDHHIMFGSRDPAKAQSLAESIGAQASGGSTAAAVAFGDVILLATPWAATEALVKSLGPLDGKILIDCTNPFVEGELAVGYTTSGAEQIALWSPAARVVKAFNTIHFQVFNQPQFGAEKAAFFYCGDDAEAKDVVAQLGQEIGLQPIDSGPLRNARLLEPMALLWVRLAFVEGLGAETALGWLQR